MRTQRRLTLGLLLVVGAAAVAAGGRLVLQLRDYRAAEAICAAVTAGDWSRALERGLRLPNRPTARRRAAQCRCTAQLETGSRAACVATLETLLAGDEQWLPSPILTAVVIEARRDGGGVREAATLAARGARFYPDDFVLGYLELNLRSQVEGEGPVIAELGRRLRARPEADPQLRVEVAERMNVRSLFESSLEVLGPRPPDRLGVVDRWFEARTLALAGTARAAALREALGEWQARGRDPVAVKAWYAILLSVYDLSDPRGSTRDLLLEAVEGSDQLQDRRLLETLYARAVRYLVTNGEPGLARRLHARASELGFEDLSGLTVEEMARTVGGERWRPQRQTGRLRFAVSDAPAGAVVLVSPGPSVAVDEPFASHVVRDGSAVVGRGADRVPVRWVLRGPALAVLGSGAAWVAPGSEVEVRIAARAPRPRPAAFVPLPRSGDGRRRVFLVVLDSGDWRLVQYLRARGEMPVFDFLVAAGLSGVLDSDPPFTGAALQALRTPAGQGPGSFVGVVHEIGREVETMNFVGRNPFAALRWLLREELDLFAVVGSGELVAADLLRSFGALRHGRNLLLTGPWGQTRPMTGFVGSREVTADERQAFPALGTQTPQDRHLVREMAADFDTILQLAVGGEVDFAALRVDALDLATHGHYAEIGDSGQDDGGGLLLEMYRYADFRLGQLWNTLDEDDVLIVVSDHGTLSSLEHDRRSLFAAAGGDLPRARLAGRPPLRSVSRTVVDQLGIEAPWPVVGLDAWGPTLAEDVESRAAGGRETSRDNP